MHRKNTTRMKRTQGTHRDFLERVTREISLGVWWWMDYRTGVRNVLSPQPTPAHNCSYSRGPESQ